MIKNLIFIFALHKTASSLFENLLRDAMKMAFQENCLLNMACVEPPCQYLLEGRDYIWGFHPEPVERCGEEDLIVFSRNLPSSMDDPVIQQYAAVAENVVVIHHIRHPWDVLISMFNSYTGTHAFPLNISQEEIEKRTKEREALRAQGVDHYVLQYASHVINETTTALQQAAVADVRHRSWLSRYEDMVEWPRHWGSMLLHTMNMSHPRTVANFDKRLAQYVRDEVRVMPNLSTHVAYLHPGSFLDILDSKVVTELQGRLDAKLKRKSGYWRRRYRL
jgi:hypothetical protein